MLSVHGIYDGKFVIITDEISEKKKFKVVITFVEEINGYDEEIRDLTAQSKGLNFWEDPREDIYQDYLTPKEK